MKTTHNQQGEVVAITERRQLWLNTLEYGEPVNEWNYSAWITAAGHAFRKERRMRQEHPIGHMHEFTEFLRTYGANGIPF